MKKYSVAYGQFVKWVQEDMSNTRVIVNRKIFSLVLWCLIIPALLSILIYGLRKYQVFAPLRFADLIIFLPPFLFATVSLWPTIREIPRVFRIGGLGAILEESAREVVWREETSERLARQVHLSKKEWSLIAFHLREDILRIQGQNRYMAVLSGVVLFFMYQFLEIGGGAEDIREPGALGVFMLWVDQFSQWGVQIFGILLFSMLFYLSGVQLQRHLIRYESCVKRLSLESDPQDDQH